MTIQELIKTFAHRFGILTDRTNSLVAVPPFSYLSSASGSFARPVAHGQLASEFD